MKRFTSWRDVEWDARRWPNFTAQELACKCGGRFCNGHYLHDEDFLDRLQDVRNTMNKPLRITSGHRCAQWNAVQGGAPLSMHKRIAVDIKLAGHDPRELLDAGVRAGFRGLGLHTGFLHLDRRQRPAVWTYGPVSNRFWLAATEGHAWPRLLASLQQ
jgi:hypothetical protein